MTPNPNDGTGQFVAGRSRKDYPMTNRATDEAERCRMLRSDDTRCPNAALPRGDDTEAALCSQHLSKALRLITATKDRQILAGKAR